MSYEYMMKLSQLKEQLLNAPIIPTLTIEQLSDAVPLAEALLAGGITVIEITLRTTAALAAIERIARQVPNITVGVGTVLTAQQFQQAIDAGSQFVVSPGVTDKLYTVAEKHRTAFIPGVITPADVMGAVERGYNLLKYFPATAMGGEQVLSAYAAVFPDIKFCPTGGISPINLPTYLALKNVLCVGGGWLTPKKQLTDKNWPAITALAEEGLQLVGMNTGEI